MLDQSGSGLVVVEGRWFDRRNLSVKSLFDVLVDINFGNPHSYYYSNFGGASDLGKLIKQQFQKHGQYRYLYVGAHGSEDCIHGCVETLSRALFRNCLLESGDKVRGVFLGSCLFGSKRNIDFLFDKSPRLRWIAGYQEEVDWMASSALDLLFWNTLFSRPRAEATEIEAIKYTCRELNRLAPGLCEKLQFRVYRRNQGPGGPKEEWLYGGPPDRCGAEVEE